MPSFEDFSGGEALARAYLDIMRLRLGDRIRIDMHCPDDLKAARMPPMMLLPLLDEALDGCNEQAVTTIRVAAGRKGAQLTISLRFRAAGELRDDEAIGAIRERLSALYGNAASFTVTARKGAMTQERLDIPLQFALEQPREEAPPT